MKKICLLSVLIIFNFSCQTGKEKLFLQHFEAMVKKKINKDYAAIIVVPSSGCGGCISDAESFLMNTYIAGNKKGIFFIVTGHSSLKSVKIRLGKASNHSDVYIDLENRFWKEPFISQYPKVYFIQEDASLREEEIKPESSEEVYQRLLSK